MKLLLAGDVDMPEIHLRPVFTYSACGPLTEKIKNKKNQRSKRFRRFMMRWLMKILRI